MKGLDYGYAATTGGVVDRRRNERKEVMDVQNVRLPLVDVIADAHVGTVGPGGFKTDFDGVVGIDSGVVENDLPDFVATGCQEGIFGFAGFVFSPPEFIAIVEGKDFHRVAGLLRNNLSDAVPLNDLRGSE